MDKSLESIIKKYERHLQAGERNVKELQSKMHKTARPLFLQLHINIVWKIVLNDLRSISDREHHESSKRS